MGPFDFVKSINYQKQDLLEDDHDGELEREYIPYIVNKALSFTPDTMLQANEMNCKPFLDKKLQYHYLLNIIRKKNRFGKWIKHETLEKIDIIQQYYGYSIEKAKQVEPIFSNSDIDTIKRLLEKGGLKE